MNCKQKQIVATINYIDDAIWAAINVATNELYSVLNDSNAIAIKLITCICYIFC